MVDSPGFTSYSVDNDRKFRQALLNAQAAVDDLTWPLNRIAEDFYRSQKAIWKLKSPGQYPDLSPGTKKDKEKKGYPVYPILKRTGRLERAASERDSGGNITAIINKQGLVMGVNETVVPYAIFHQEGTRKMPMRKFLFIGPEALRFANSEQAGRLNRWVNTLEEFVFRMAEKKLKGAA